MLRNFYLRPVDFFLVAQKLAVIGLLLHPTLLLPEDPQAMSRKSSSRNEPFFPPARRLVRELDITGQQGGLRSEQGPRHLPCYLTTSSLKKRPPDLLTKRRTGVALSSAIPVLPMGCLALLVSRLGLADPLDREGPDDANHSRANQRQSQLPSTQHLTSSLSWPRAGASRKGQNAHSSPFHNTLIPEKPAYLHPLHPPQPASSGGAKIGVFWATSTSWATWGFGLKVLSPPTII